VQYYATGTAHAPHHAPKDWIARFKGQFDQGWDKMREETFARQKAMGVIPPDAKLTPRPAEIPAWDSFDADHKRVFARMMEIYAAALSHADHQMGRILDTIQELGELDNTLVIYIQGDNGASAEGTPQGLLNEMAVFNGIPEDFAQILARMDELGGPTTFNHYPVGWAHAMDTPFQWTKQIASHFGGTRNGLVISWPARIKDKGGIRSQFHHVIDIAPTILDAVGVPAPAVLNGVPQKPIEGVSMVYSFDDAKAPSTHRTQYFEMFANRAIYHDGWVAATTPPILPWAFVAETPSVDGYKWELYNVAEDFSQADDLAAKNPAKLKELQDLFMKEAIRNHVLPIDDRRSERFNPAIAGRPDLLGDRKSLTVYPGMTGIMENAFINVKGVHHTVTAEVELKDARTSGVIIAQAGYFGGWALYMKDGKPRHEYNWFALERTNIGSATALKPGKHTIVYEFIADEAKPGTGGRSILTVDGQKVAEGKIPKTQPFAFSADEGTDVGVDGETNVSTEYKQGDNAFTGKIVKVTVEQR
jgi:arylsulfatase